MSILHGLRVVELSAFVAVPLAGATLASMGAEVIRIDPLGGGLDSARLPRLGSRSLYWAGLNQGKRSVALKLTDRRAQQLVARLVVAGGEAGGIVITNLPARGWSSYESLRHLRPDLIMVRLQGNPDGSPAVDYTVNARLGYPMVTGPEGHVGPVDHVLPAWDAQAGYLVALAVLAAERHRRLTGEGQLVSLNLVDVGLTLTARLGILAEAELITEPRRRVGNYVYGTFGKNFRTCDGREVMVVALTARQWRALLDATGLRAEMEALAAAHRWDLNDEKVRWEAREQIAEILERWTRGRTQAEVALAFDGAEVVWAPFQSFKELMSDDTFASSANPVLARIHDEGVGDYVVARSPVRFAGAGEVRATPPPRLGEHTEEVLRAAGAGDAEIAELRRTGIIGADAVASRSPTRLAPRRAGGVD